MSNKNAHAKSINDAKPCFTAEKLAKIKREKAEKVDNNETVKK